MIMALIQSTLFKYKKFVVWAVLLLVTLLGCVASIPSRVDALSGSQFQAGRIIDDGVFYNSSAMTAGQIQTFLNSKLPTCDTNGTQPYAGTTRASYGTSRGYPPPYTCLKDYKQAIPTVVNGGSDLCKQSIVGGTKSAAQIIADVSRACGINPQVLLVLLQKEQSLVTDDWPWSIQYRSATGYGCPDTAPCDSEFYGFFNQVYQAAKAYRRYEANPTQYNYRSGRNNTILWHPNASCGSSTVFIQNQATASLYIYTPYRPNAAALNNLYGTGDACSSYGNRNFWRMFNDWFGSTLSSAYEAQFVRQSAYPSMFPGDSSNAYIDYKNVGLNTWYDKTSVPVGQQPISFATSSPINRASDFGTDWGSGKNRPTTLFNKVFEADGTTLAANQHRALPGQIVRFAFTFKAPANLASGQYTEWFQPIVEGSSNWNMGGKAWLRATVAKPTFSAAFHSQSIYPTLKQNGNHDAYIQYRNSGNQPWYEAGSNPAGVAPVVLATTENINRASQFGATWGNGKNRPAIRFAKVFESNGATLASNQNVVQPGQIVRFEFSFTAPSDISGAIYREWFQPIREGSSNWNMGGKAWLQAKVIATTHSATFHKQCAFPVVNRGSTASCFLEYKNTGSSNWFDMIGAPSGIKPTNLATTNSINRASQLGGLWGNGKNRPSGVFARVFEADGITLTADQHLVRPGQIARFEFTFSAPANLSPGKYREWFQPILEGTRNWNIGGTAWIEPTVQ